jgi:hypothetical protein
MDTPKIGWIVYRPNPEKLIDFVGIYPTQELAEKGVTDLKEKLPGNWQATSVPFQGWTHFPPAAVAEQSTTTVRRP